MKHKSFILIFITILVLVRFDSELVAQESQIDFSRDIQPILSENCYFCHGPDSKQRAADLRLDVEDDAKAYFQPGDADASELYLRICSDDDDEKMPPPDSNRSLNPGQIKLIKRWLNQGAKWSQHWAFRPIARSDTPADKAIDTFVAKKLKQNGLDFSPAADANILIRRISLDLTGLPPTPQQIDTFLKDDSPDAYRKMVNRFLASPAYGQRMAWTWLDAARYADSNGYQGDNERTMWPWRDWVVDAYNQNMPFDQFSTWQLAGDLLPNATEKQILATGFNRNHPINGEGGRIAEENRIDYVMDMAETTGTVWMGLTFNCCRCHDHKYDQLSQEDYYSLFAFFNQTPVTGGGDNAKTPPVLSVPDENQRKQKNRLESQLAVANDKLAKRKLEIESFQTEWETAEQKRIKERNHWNVLKPEKFYAVNSRIKKLAGDSLLIFGGNPNQNNYHVTASSKLKTIRAIRLEALNHNTMTKKGLSRSSSSNFVLTDFTVYVVAPDGEPVEIKIASAIADYEQLPVKHAIDDNPKTGWAVWAKDKDMTQEHEAVFVFEKAVELPEKAKLKIILKHESDHKQHTIGHFRISATENENPQLLNAGTELADALKTSPSNRTKEQNEVITNTYLEQDDEHVLLLADVKKVEQKIARLNKSIPQVMVMADKPQYRKSFRLNRGSYQEPLDEVFARVPKLLSPLPAKSKSNRLALANWLFEKSNPLTPRVSVNRIWVQFFGTGIVKTTEDFGVQGEPPSHPELLDWLAAEYRDSGWDTKHVIRLILNSQTYRQSSKTNPKLLKLDPENRLLARASRFRMPAWMLRDNALAASGHLVGKPGGPPVNTYQPAGVWEEASFGKKKFKLDSGESLYRRSLYTFWRRIAAPTMFFDNADRMTCSVKTYRTNTPLHALNTLNDITFVEAARLLATKVLDLDDAKLKNPDLETDKARLKIVFRRLVSRDPDPTEAKILIGALNRTRTQYSANPKSAKAFIEIGESPTNNKIEAVELASWTSLCLAVINLDEALTRQ